MKRSEFEGAWVMSRAWGLIRCQDIATEGNSQISSLGSRIDEGVIY